MVKRRGRRGRPATPGERTKSGRLTGRERKERKRRQQEREQKEAVKIAIGYRKRHLGVSEELASHPLIFMVPYRWLHRGHGEGTLIQRHHYDAAEAYLKARRNYLRAIQARSPDLPRSGGGVDPDPSGSDPGYIERCQRAIATFDTLRTNLRRQGLLDVVEIVAVNNQDRPKFADMFREAMNIVHRALIGNFDT